MRAIVGVVLRANNGDVLRAPFVNKFTHTKTCAVCRAIFVELDEQKTYKHFCELRDKFPHASEKTLRQKN